MKAKDISILHDIEHDSNLVVGKKYNGYNEILVISNGIIQVFNRSGSEQTENVPHITKLHVPNYMDIIISCEGIAISNRVEDAKSIFGSGPQHAIEWQQVNGNAIMVAFDIKRFDGDDISNMLYGDRLTLLSGVVTELNSLGMTGLTQEILYHNNKMQLFQKVIEEGGEGVVVKNLKGLEDSWFKVKKTRSWDVVITGFTEANIGKTGKFKGLIGAIRYGFYFDGGLIEMGKCSGMTNAQRIDFTNHQEYYIGKVIEVKGQELGNRNGIVFPRFLRIRDDKLPSECVFNR